jgi:hypothetical protein
MNLRQVLHWWRAAPDRALPRAATPDWVTAGSRPRHEQRDQALPGCGWFDSSHELHAGLQVTEHLTPERIANDVPLGWWLDWHSGAAAPSTHGGLCRR